MFGEETKQAVMWYQEVNGISKDGVVGSKTFRYMFKVS
ncbi:MAG: peptidoglycan-binding protein [Clostridium sp.]|nr:peptidoglycan-binding protein [Clostridium sp.]